MPVTTLSLTDFRCFEEVSFEPDPTGLTVLRGENGTGKTSVLEALAWLATQRSFRGAGREAMVRNGQTRAVVRAQADGGTRRVLLEAELPVDGPARLQCNRQPVRRRGDLDDVLTVSVFSPGDLEVVQSGPEHRRRFVDDLLAARHPRYEALIAEVERVLRQRGALLRQSGTRPGPEVLSTLDVWDGRLAASGEALAAARQALVDDLAPLARAAYADLAGAAPQDGEGQAILELEYRRSWTGDLADALAATRQEDLRRQQTTTGPQRDDLRVVLSGRPARSQASQGEQRATALSLRLAGHLMATAERGRPPVLLLDDVFSELDHHRAQALVEQLPAGQVLLTTAVDPPPVVSADRVVEVTAGRLCALGGGK